MNYNDKQVSDSVRRVKTFIDTNKRRPQTVRVNKDTVKIDDYLRLAQLKDAKNRLDKFIKNNGRYPNTLRIIDQTLNIKQYRTLYSLPTLSNTVSNDQVFQYFIKTFGNVKTIEEALNKVKDHGYSYYYNDVYTNKTSIDRMKKGLGINCTDSCGVFYRIAKALNYDVRCLHVQCKSGGHVRLQVRKGNQNWKNIDPACVLSKNGKGINCIWCPDAKLIDIDPKWFINNTKR